MQEKHLVDQKCVVRSAEDLSCSRSSRRMLPCSRRDILLFGSCSGQDPCTFDVNKRYVAIDMPIISLVFIEHIFVLI